MSKNNLPESPLFQDEEELDKKLTIQQLKEKGDIENKKKTLTFCLSAAKWIAPIAFLLIGVDMLLQHWKMDSTLLKDCFSLLTYVVTAALGFVFANNSK